MARRDASAVAAELRKIYTAPAADAAFEALAGFAASGPGQKYPQAVKVREAAWDRFTPFLAFTPPVRKLLWLAILNIEDKRARERAARRGETGKRSDQPARLIEG